MLDLLDYRRTVTELYTEVRQQNADETIHATWRAVRDDLFAHHSQSALDEEQKARFKALAYFEYDPLYDVLGEFIPRAEPQIIAGELGDDGTIRYQHIGDVRFTVPTGTGQLSVYWIMGYGGGIFIPFRDATNKQTTYGAGRYLYDTIKGADLGLREGQFVMNFNYAYHPSCAYHYRWVCPLAQPDSQLTFEIPAGERLIQI